MANRNHKYYRDGLKTEAQIIKWLKDRGHTVAKSTRYQDINLDIDAIVDGRLVSIKSQNKAAETGNFAFETHTYTRTGYDRWYNDAYEWLPSWYHQGKADYYLIKVKSTLYRIDRKELHQWVETNQERTQTRKLSRQVQAKQRAIGHRDANARVMLIRMADLVTEGVAKRVGFVK